MTPQKAIEFLDETIIGCAIMKDKQLADVCMIAISAIEKQMPKRPEYWGDGCDDEGNIAYDYAKCPKCGKNDFEYGINDWGCNFCPECGQALDWSEQK